MKITGQSSKDEIENEAQLNDYHVDSSLSFIDCGCTCGALCLYLSHSEGLYW